MTAAEVAAKSRCHQAVVKALSGLRVLDLSSNLIEDADGVTSLPALYSLDLSSNRLSYIPCLASHTQLTHLNLRKNSLTSLQAGT